MTPVRTGADRERVPVRTILATIGLLLATTVSVLFVMRIERVLVWMVIALFFAVALHPLVGWVHRHVTRRRSIAALLVFLLVTAALGGLLAVFAVPLAQQGAQLAGRLPGMINDARAGRGPVGQLLERVNALGWVQTHQDRISEYATGLGTSVLNALWSAGSAVATAVTIFVLAYLAVIEGPKIVDGSLALFPPQRAERIRKVAADCARTVTGYISGNLLISAICGLLTFAVLQVSGVPFAGLIALFVAVADLIPMVGAPLGSVVATIAGFVHSVPAGITVIVFFVLYQLLENHLLQPLVYARTVKLNPLAVLVAILVGVELAGILGALLAIPVAGILQVILRDLWDHRRGRPRSEFTVGPDHRPVDRADDPTHRAIGPTPDVGEPDPAAASAGRGRPTTSAVDIPGTPRHSPA
jgi:predicted PurR-regulated permease PerM